MNAVTAQEVPAILLNLDARVATGMRADPFCVSFGFRVYRRLLGSHPPNSALEIGPPLSPSGD